MKHHTQSHIALHQRHVATDDGLSKLNLLAYEHVLKQYYIAHADLHICL